MRPSILIELDKIKRFVIRSVDVKVCDVLWRDTLFKFGGQPLGPSFIFIHNVSHHYLLQLKEEIENDR